MKTPQPTQALLPQVVIQKDPKGDLVSTPRVVHEKNKQIENLLAAFPQNLDVKGVLDALESKDINWEQGRALIDILHNHANRLSPSQIKAIDAASHTIDSVPPGLIQRSTSHIGC